MKKDNVVLFPGLTRLDLNPDQVLEYAVEKLESVVIAGYTKDGNEYFASSMADDAEILWLLERFKMHLLNGMENGDC